MAITEKQRAKNRKKYLADRENRLIYCHKYYEKNKESIRRKYYEKREQLRGNKTEWAKYAAYTTKNRAKKIGVDHNITARDILLAMSDDGLCPALGVELVFFNKGICPQSASVDRLSPKKGYVKGNIRVISTMANMIKSHSTSWDDVQKVADWMKSETEKIIL